MKDYKVNISLHSFEFTLKAKNKTEAKNKAIEKLEKKRVKAMIDKQNSFVDETFF